jgi:RNA polymerase sigma factor (sigma-70 family)
MSSVHRGSALKQINRLFDEGTLAGLPDGRLLERYVSERDELAFESLVQRHGAMVKAVCLGVVHDPNDADDAFQAAFLLLARKAERLWVSDSLGGWLHRVACRIALQVKSDTARRRDRERRAADLAGTRSFSAPPGDDVPTVLHEEIDRLPERYRKPIVLCYLEEMTYQQAATHLRWSEGTTRGRLARAREMLRARLNGRGIQSAGGALPVFSLAARSLALAPELVQTTVRAARHFTLGNTAQAVAVSATATALVQQAMRTMMVAKLKVAGVAALVVGVLSCVATGLAAVGPLGPAVREGVNAPEEGRTLTSPEAGGVAKAEAVNKPGEQQESVSLYGRVLGPDGKPASGAMIYTFSPKRGEPIKAALRPQAGADGKFQFDVSRAEIDAIAEISPFTSLMVVATAPGLGPDWVELRKPPEGELSLRLVDDSVPIAARIVDLQGKPVAGARITRGRINAFTSEAGIEPFLTLVREDVMQASNYHFPKNYWESFELPGQAASVVTDADGRFRLSGIGRDRIVKLSGEGPSIQRATIDVMTRAGAKVSSPPGSFGGQTIYPASFEHFIPPGRALTGVVRDKKTKSPMAGVEVCGHETNARTKTDEHGRYTLVGFPKSKHYDLMVLAGDRSPYFVTSMVVPDTSGLEPIEANVECQAGIPLRLKLIDKETGKPVRNADVFYEPIYPNPHVREVPGYTPVRGSGPYNSGVLQENGSYALGVLPGPGGVFVRTAQGKYRPACVDPRKFFNVKDAPDRKRQQLRLYGDTDTINTAVGEGMGGMPQSQFSAIVLVNPAEDSGPVSAEAILESDPKREVRVIGPDGEALTGVVTEGEGAESSSASGTVTVSQLNVLRPRRFLFRHDARKLIGCLVVKGDEAEPYVVKLQPWGTISGRLVDAGGKPRAKVDLMTADWQQASIDPARGVISYGQKTGNDGRFRYDRLVPGQDYSAHSVGEQAMKGGFGVVIDRVVLKPGETRDLGDVQTRLEKPEMKP